MVYIIYGEIVSRKKNSNCVPVQVRQIRKVKENINHTSLFTFYTDYLRVVEFHK